MMTHLGTSTNGGQANSPSSISTHRIASSATKSDHIRIKTLMKVAPEIHIYVAQVVKDFDSSLDPDNVARVRSLQIQKSRVSS